MTAAASHSTARSAGRRETRPTVSLERFLAELPAEDAAEARAAAARIDALEREIGPPGWLERRVIRLGLAALALFAAGVALLLARAYGLQGLPGAVLVPLLGAFPALVLAYMWSVRGRSRLDHEKMALNESHFLPHGGVYFGGQGGDFGGDQGNDLGGAGRVMRVERPRAKASPNLRERTHALHAEATKRRWWW